MPSNDFALGFEVARDNAALVCSEGETLEFYGEGYTEGYRAASKKYAKAIAAMAVPGYARKWPLMGYGNVAIGGGHHPEDGTSCLMFMDMGETREVGADTSDLFPVGSEADASKTLACIYFKDGEAMQTVIDALEQMQSDVGFVPGQAVGTKQDQPTDSVSDDPYNGDDGPGFDYEFHAKLLAGAHLLSDEQKEVFDLAWDAAKNFVAEKAGEK